MAKWAQDNKHIFEENGMIFRDIVGTCFVKNPEIDKYLKPRREESAKLVWDAIATCSSNDRVTFVQESGGILTVVKKIVKWLLVWTEALEDWTDKDIDRLMTIALKKLQKYNDASEVYPNSKL